MFPVLLNCGICLTEIALRAVLNYKGIPYRTKWVESPDIAPLSKKLGINPTGLKKDGSPLYTLPAIHDPSTGTYIADSLAIAEYLERTYPDTPSVFPSGTATLQKAFESNLISTLGAAWAFSIPASYSRLNPVSAEYFRRTSEISYGMKLEDSVPTGDARIEEWGKFEKGMDRLHSYLISTDKNGPYMMGNTISWSDLVLFSFLSYFKAAWGGDSQEWKDIASWNDGRWEAYMNALKECQTVV